MPVYHVNQVDGLNTDDGLTPETAWKTVSKVNGAGLSPGDVVLFRRGDVWAEQLAPGTSGVDGNPIRFGAYGSGAPPKIIGGGWALTTGGRDYLDFTTIEFVEKLVYVPSGSVGIVFNGCPMINSVTQGVWATGGSHVTLNRCAVLGARQSGVYAEAGSTIVMRGSIVAGNLTQGVSCDATSTIDYDYCSIFGNGGAIANNFSGSGTFVDGGHNILTNDPRLVRYPNNSAIFCLTIDDADVDYALAVAAALPAGVAFTFFVNPGSFSDANAAKLATLTAAGHEIAIHGWTHSLLSATSAFQVTTTNASPSITIDYATKTLTLATTTPGNTVVVDYSSGQTITSLKAAVAGKGWTITNSSNIDNPLKLTSLAAAASSTFPYTALLDIAAPGYRFYDDEIRAARDWIESKTGLAPTTIAYPYGFFSAELIAYCKDVLGLRGGRAVGGTRRLDAIKIYEVAASTAAGWKGDGSEADIRKYARHVYVHGQGSGAIMATLAHNNAELAPQQWGWFVDEVLALGGSFVRFDDAVEEIRAGHASADGLTYTKNYADASDLRTRPGSPCRKVGIDVGLATDLTGWPIQASPDIGPYQSRQPAKGRRVGRIGFR